MIRRINEKKIAAKILDMIERDNKILWKLAWRVFLMLFLIFGVLGSITGWNIHGLFTQLQTLVNNRITKEFETPVIKETIKDVAIEQADSLLKKQINPEVENFKAIVESKLNDLEMKSIALNKLQDNVNQSLRNIDSMMFSIDKTSQEIINTKNRVLEIENDIKTIAELAKPNSIKLYKKDIKQTNKVKVVVLQFKPTKNEPFGIIVFHASILNKANSKILNIQPSIEGGAYATGDGSVKISEDGKIAQLSYSLIGAGIPYIEITLSENAKLKIEGNYLLNPLIVDVK